MTEGIPAQFDHCLRVYALMEREAQTEEVGEITDDPILTVVRRVWEGHTTRIFNQLELSTPYYTSVLNHLKRMGCIVQLRRGGGSATSKWELVREPTLELYEARGPGNVNPTTLKGRVEALEKVARDQQRKMDVLLNHLGVKL